MYLRLARNVSGQEGVDARLIAGAAQRSGGPQIEVGAGLGLAISYASGGQLGDFGHWLTNMPEVSGVVASSPLVLDILDELNRCSGVYVVDRPHEVLLVSDRSRVEFQAVQSAYGEIATEWDRFRPSVSGFEAVVDNLPPPA
jgi:hypothetical protein